VNASGGRRNRSDAVLLWLATILVACAGLYIAFVALAGAIDRQHELTARVADALRVNAEIAAQGPALEREQRMLDDRMRGFDLRADRAALVARFVQTAARVAGEHGVSLDRVDARAAAAAPPATALAASSPSSVSFESLPLEVTLSGGY
jgi:hypothetical protein